jgi:Ca-activated chloride channel family protein
MTAWQFTLLGFPVRLAHPEYGALLPIGLLGLALGLLAARRKRLAFERLAPGRLLEHVLVGPSAGRALARSTLSWTALLLAAGALMQPQCGSHTELTKKFGIDVVIAIDASKSMLARDVKPSRIERAKLELSGLLDKIKGDRVGIVVFAGDAFVQCPMTTDYAAAKMFLRSVDTASMPVPGTDLGRALDTSRDLLMEADRGAKSRAIVLLSDGEDFGGDYSDSIKALNDDGIKVISVGIGSAAGEPIPELDKHGNVVGYAKDKEGNTVMTRLNESDLAAIADKTDGAYIASVPGSIGVGAVAEQLDRLQKSELESRISVSYEERFSLFLAPALALLLLAAGLRPSRSVGGWAAITSGTLLGLACAGVGAEGALLMIDDAQKRLLATGALGAASVLLFLVAILLDLRRQGSTHA